MDFTSGNSNIYLKLLIEKNSQKLLFAEASKDMVDFLISLVSVPIGSIAKLITEESAFVPLSNTYRSWEKLNHELLLSGDHKMMAHKLIPAIDIDSRYSNFTHVLSSAIPSTISEKIYACSCKNNIGYMLGLSNCKTCKAWGTVKELSFEGYGVTKEKIQRDGYVKGGYTYAVMDDLSIVPMTPSTSIAFLNKMGHKDISLLEEKSVCMDIRQGLELLKISLKSKTVLTDMFLTKKKGDEAKKAN